MSVKLNQLQFDPAQIAELQQVVSNTIDDITIKQYRAQYSYIFSNLDYFSKKLLTYYDIINNNQNAYQENMDITVTNEISTSTVNMKLLTLLIQCVAKIRMYFMQYLFLYPATLIDGPLTYNFNTLEISLFSQQKCAATPGSFDKFYPIITNLRADDSYTNKDSFWTFKYLLHLIYLTSQGPLNITSLNNLFDIFNVFTQNPNNWKLRFKQSSDSDTITLTNPQGVLSGLKTLPKWPIMKDLNTPEKIAQYKIDANNISNLLINITQMFVPQSLLKKPGVSTVDFTTFVDSWYLKSDIQYGVFAYYIIHGVNETMNIMFNQFDFYTPVDSDQIHQQLQQYLNISKVKDDPTMFYTEDQKNLVRDFVSLLQCLSGVFLEANDSDQSPLQYQSYIFMLMPLYKYFLVFTLGKNTNETGLDILNYQYNSLTGYNFKAKFQQDTWSLDSFVGGVNYFYSRIGLIQGQQSSVKTQISNIIHILFMIFYQQFFITPPHQICCDISDPASRNFWSIQDYYQNQFRYFLLSPSQASISAGLDIAKLTTKVSTGFWTYLNVFQVNQAFSVGTTYYNPSMFRKGLYLFSPPIQNQDMPNYQICQQISQINPLVYNSQISQQNITVSQQCDFSQNSLQQQAAQQNNIYSCLPGTVTYQETDEDIVFDPYTCQNYCKGGKKYVPGVVGGCLSVCSSSQKPCTPPCERCIAKCGFVVDGQPDADAIFYNGDDTSGNPNCLSFCKINYPANLVNFECSQFPQIVNNPTKVDIIKNKEQFTQKKEIGNNKRKQKEQMGQIVVWVDSILIVIIVVVVAIVLGVCLSKDKSKSKC